ncbi:hypothetical protein EVAR_82599_1 [Eumeta japonica]|uniref:Uncharacterized protein n=1 Tax=Eumeta variegata TaxID=151549 RepID=A0A4C1X4Q0_EUMVA|nr:hypothetical protein EVAR_82599_1 [Eumeta japonica]
MSSLPAAYNLTRQRNRSEPVQTLCNEIRRARTRNLSPTNWPAEEIKEQFLFLSSQLRINPSRPAAGIALPISVHNLALAYRLTQLISSPMQVPNVTSHTPSLLNLLLLGNTAPKPQPRPARASGRLIENRPPRAATRYYFDLSKPNSNFKVLVKNSVGRTGHRLHEVIPCLSRVEVARALRVTPRAPPRAPPDALKYTYFAMT